MLAARGGSARDRQDAARSVVSHRADQRLVARDDFGKKSGAHSDITESCLIEAAEKSDPIGCKKTG